jgi:hypothetical protein
MIIPEAVPTEAGQLFRFLNLEGCLPGLSKPLSIIDIICPKFRRASRGYSAEN